MLGDTGTVNLSTSGITDLANTFYGATVGWIFAAVVIATYAAGRPRRAPKTRGRRRHQRAAGR